MKEGDTVEVLIDGVGHLSNTIAKERIGDVRS
jgi:2-keto-4-pentenoate hydratase/2-oxohepta-3-ene-1,7-dioic acid hydratase in catechol pathway